MRLIILLIREYYCRQRRPNVQLVDQFLQPVLIHAEISRENRLTTGEPMSATAGKESSIARPEEFIVVVVAAAFAAAAAAAAAAISSAACTHF